MSGIKPTPNDPLLPKYTDRCRCMACGHYFRSSGTFARHRVGNWDQDGANRRCLTPEEMRSKGWSQDDLTYWIRDKHTAASARRSGHAVNSQE